MGYAFLDIRPHILVARHRAMMAQRRLSGSVVSLALPRFPFFAAGLLYARWRNFDGSAAVLCWFRDSNRGSVATLSRRGFPIPRGGASFI